MGLILPREGGSAGLESTALYSNATSDVTITASATPHAKGSPTQLVGSTNYPVYGVIVGLGNVGTAATTNSRMLVDIMIGGAGAEQVLIPDLMCGQAGAMNSASSQPVYYYFPIRIAQTGVRLSARAQALIASDTVHVQLHMIQNAIPGRWYGSRVTAYGVSAATSSGVSHTPAGSGTAYATTTQITASTTNPVKAMQVGIDLATDTTGSNARGVLRIAAGSSTNYVVSDLPFRESTTLEFIDPSVVNFMLSQMTFNIPAASYLGVGAMMSTAAARGFAIYGVD
jgi:hypothetical protein